MHLVLAFCREALSQSSWALACLTAARWQSTCTKLKCETVEKPMLFFTPFSTHSKGALVVKV